MTTKNSKQITLFIYVKTVDGYAKQPITLYELLARLSEKTAAAPAPSTNKSHSRE